MKKFFAILLCLCMVFALVACNTPDADDKDENKETEAPATDDTAAAEAEYKLGMGIVVSTDSSASATAEKAGTAQIDATVAAVVLDKDGKIVVCRIDSVQNKIGVNADGTITMPEKFLTKMELGDNYNMAKYGASMDWNKDGVVKEWYDQAKAFETFVVGKTAAEVEAMGTQTLDNGYVISSDDALLSAGCTIQITEFKAAVAKACKDEQGMSFKTASAFTLGVAAKSANDASKDAEVVQVYSDFAASVVADGKIIATLNDAIQPKIAINAAGEIGETKYTDTKRCLKEDYNMAKFGAAMDPNNDGKVLEWYLQSEAFSKHVVGMTGAEVAAMTTATNSIGYQMTTDADLLAAGCTIQITAITAVVAQSAANAR